MYTEHLCFLRVINSNRKVNKTIDISLRAENTKTSSSQTQRGMKKISPSKNLKVVYFDLWIQYSILENSPKEKLIHFLLYLESTSKCFFFSSVYKNLSEHKINSLLIGIFLKLTSEYFNLFLKTPNLFFCVYRFTSTNVHHCLFFIFFLFESVYLFI